MFSGNKYQNIQQDLLKIELIKKFGGSKRELTCTSELENIFSLLESPPEQPLVEDAGIDAFSTLKKLITSKPAPASGLSSSAPTQLAKTLSTLLPAFLQQQQQQQQSPTSFLQMFPPLEVELTEDSNSSIVDLASPPSFTPAPDHDLSLSTPAESSLTMAVSSSSDQIPITINNLSPRYKLAYKTAQIVQFRRCRNPCSP